MKSKTSVSLLSLLWGGKESERGRNRKQGQREGKIKEKRRAMKDRRNEGRTSGTEREKN